MIIFDQSIFIEHRVHRFQDLLSALSLMGLTGINCCLPRTRIVQNVLRAWKHLPIVLGLWLTALSQHSVRRAPTDSTTSRGQEKER